MSTIFILYKIKDGLQFLFGAVLTRQRFGPLYTVHRTFNRFQYSNLLEILVYPYVKEIFADGNYTFLQDRSPIHTSLICSDEELCFQNSRFYAFLCSKIILFMLTKPCFYAQNYSFTLDIYAFFLCFSKLYSSNSYDIYIPVYKYLAN